MSHLIMLAPADFGSALAQLRKGKIGRLKAWFGDVEPGTGVLDWLELGSPEAWTLNTTWIQSKPGWSVQPAIFPFVLMGQTIDRKLYNHVNSYTGETGSDGVVRVAAANLNARYARLVDGAKRTPHIEEPDRSSGQWVAPKLELNVSSEAPRTAFLVLPKLCEEFGPQTDATQEAEQIEPVKHTLLPNTYFVHDRYAQLMMRLTDDAGYPIEDFDVVLTAGKDNSPDQLPAGFFVDRQ